MDVSYQPADFTECFSLWCEEEPESSSSAFNIIAQHMESGMTNKCEELLSLFDVKYNLDTLHSVVTEARARKQSGYSGKDAWREDLQPRVAVRAQTTPLLRQERDRLKAQLAELDSSNQQLQSEMQVNVEARTLADNESEQLLDKLEEALSKWSDVPLEEIESWTLQTAEIINNTTLSP